MTLRDAYMCVILRLTASRQGRTRHHGDVMVFPSSPRGLNVQWTRAGGGTSFSLNDAPLYCCDLNFVCHFAFVPDEDSSESKRCTIKQRIFVETRPFVSAFLRPCMPNSIFPHMTLQNHSQLHGEGDSGTSGRWCGERSSAAKQQHRSHLPPRPREATVTAAPPGAPAERYTAPPPTLQWTPAAPSPPHRATVDGKRGAL